MTIGTITIHLDLPRRGSCIDILGGNNVTCGQPTQASRFEKARKEGPKGKKDKRQILKAANHKRYDLLTNLSNASPEAIWNSDKPELTIIPPFLTRRP
jgi:hypothetical protein